MGNNNHAKKKPDEIRSRVKPDAKPDKSGDPGGPAGKTSETAYKGCRIVDNVEADACQIFFNDFPTQTVRHYLLRNEFDWSEINQCWSRARSEQARFHAKKAIDKMTKPA
ncbi:MAG: hypothetical protein ABSE00_10830 [Chitinispirillaceae bacterium]|jgi:hypothetical protein